MCAAAVELRIQWRLPIHGGGDGALELPADEDGDDEDEGPACAPAGRGPGNLFPELQVGFEFARCRFGTACHTVLQGIEQ